MSELDVPLWVWAATVGVIVLVLGGELVVGAGRRPREVRIGAAALYVAVVVGLAVLFGLALIWLGHPGAGGRFFAAWLTEYTLSVDNLLIFVLLIGGSAVPRELHSRVLLLGVAMALVLRGIFIAVGAAAISRFDWVLYLFGALLFYAAARLIAGSRSDRQVHGDGIVLRAVKRAMPVSVTPFLLLVVVVAGTDLMFAVDSIPAIFGLTRDPYIIFTANAFALLGLRQLYFVVGGLLSRLVYLSAGLAAILAFIGFKLSTQALSGSGVEAIGPVPVPHISSGLSLAVVGGVLVIATIASVVSGKQAGGPSLSPAGDDLCAPRRSASLVAPKPE